MHDKLLFVMKLALFMQIALLITLMVYGFINGYKAYKLNQFGKEIDALEVKTEENKKLMQEKCGLPINEI